MTDSAETSISMALRERITEAASQWVELPLLAGVRDGSLDTAVFRHYLEQDYRYLHYYARIYSRLAAQAATDDELEHFIALANGILSVELEHHKHAAAPFGCDFDRIEPSPQLRDYLAFYDAIADDRDATLVAMLPCIYGYGVALALIRDATVDGPYRDWIDIYTGGDYAAIMDRHFAMVDGSSLSPDRALAIVEQGLAHEIEFWNQRPEAPEVQ